MRKSRPTQHPPQTNRQTVAPRNAQGLASRLPQTVLGRALEVAEHKAVADGLVKMEGTGRKTDPFRYWLPAAEERWRRDPLHQLLEKQNRDTQTFLEALRSGKAPGESGRQ